MIHTQPNFCDLTGKVFGNVTVISESRIQKRCRVTWVCRCKCGKEWDVTSSDLKSGRVISCGCVKKQRIGQLNLKHGITRNRKQTPEYSVWLGVKRRCLQKTHEDYSDYGGRGIKMHLPWQSDFLSFYKHVGKRPSPKHSLDRIKVNGNYEPGNVRWATGTEQANNKRNNVTLTYDGKSRTLMQWSRILGIQRQTLSKRLGYGWPLEKVFSTALRPS